MPSRQEVQRILTQIGLHPQQAAGQNFLLDETVVQAMTAAAEVKADDTVLEIGPGLGLLTEALLDTGTTVVGVELDRRLFSYLQRRFQGQKKLQLIHGDIFRINLNDRLVDGQYKLVANLPYSATALVFRNFLTLPPRPSVLTVMIQKEAAERIMAKPGAMSLLSLLAQYYSHPHLLLTVPPARFYPTPKVQSAVLQCVDVRSPDAAESATVFRIARAGFSSRRKQLRNSLAAGLHLAPVEVDERLRRAGIDPTTRAQALSVDNWRELARAGLNPLAQYSAE